MGMYRSTKTFVADFVKNFSFTSKQQQQDFERQINEDVREAVGNVDDGNLDIEEKIDSAEFVASNEEIPESAKDDSYFAESLKEFNRLAILSHIEDEFFKIVKNRMEKRFVELPLSNLRIWSVKVYPENKEHYSK